MQSELTEKKVPAAVRLLVGIGLVVILFGGGLAAGSLIGYVIRSFL